MQQLPILPLLDLSENEELYNLRRQLGVTVELEYEKNWVAIDTNNPELNPSYRGLEYTFSNGKSIVLNRLRKGKLIVIHRDENEIIDGVSNSLYLGVGYRNGIPAGIEGVDINNFEREIKYIIEDDLENVVEKTLIAWDKHKPVIVFYREFDTRHRFVGRKYTAISKILNFKRLPANQKDLIAMKPEGPIVAVRTEYYEPENRKTKRSNHVKPQTAETRSMPKCLSEKLKVHDF